MPSVRYLTLIIFIVLSTAQAQELNVDFYQIGSPSLIEYYVDPVSGNDSNSGLSLSNPKRTVTSIWNSLASNLSQGVRINLAAGNYNSEFPNYWENKHGSQTAPIILQGTEGVLFERDINMANVSYFYLIGITIQNTLPDGYGDSFHCEKCDHILLRSNSFNGAVNGLTGSIARETIKFNQSQYIYIENNNIEGADDNAIDWVAVQYGSIRANRIHNTQGWCTYVKGGSSYITIEGNYVHDCGEGGITAGQGTGFEFMEDPWIRYEANYIKIINNVIYDVYGAALGVNGGYNVLLAHNTAYRVGARSHLLEVVFGERSCDGDISACSQRQSLGGWGPSSTSVTEPIGNRHVYIYNNIFYNPFGIQSAYQHFAIYGPRSASAPGLAPTQYTDTDLQIKGNWIWNGPSDHPLGFGSSDSGCYSTNPTCNTTQVDTDNYINQAEPQFINSTSHDFRPAATGNLFLRSIVNIPDFLALESIHNPIPEGNIANSITRDFAINTSSLLSGAFSNSDSDIDLPIPGDVNTAPSITDIKIKKVKNGNSYKLNFSLIASDSDGVANVNLISLGRNIPMRLKRNRYTSSFRFRSSKRRINYKIVATDTLAASRELNKSYRIR